jgi:predicted GIY-YIG superfamily endonuclease
VSKKTGVYIIRNTITGKAYVGSSVNVTARLNGHKKTPKMWEASQR